MNFRKGNSVRHSSAIRSSVYAQEQKVEVFGEYSYLRFNPTLSYLKNRSFNGAAAASNTISPGTRD